MSSASITSPRMRAVPTHSPMGRGKSWDAHENAALAQAWVDSWNAAGKVAETGSRSFARAVHERFSQATPPSGGPPPPGRYSARSEQACKQHFADLAAEVRRAGSVPPPLNSPIARAWLLLRTVPRFKSDGPKIETDEEGVDEITEDVPTSTPGVPSSGVQITPSVVTSLTPTPTPASTSKKPRKRLRTLDQGPTSTPTNTALGVAGEQIFGLNSALKSLADALRALVDTHGERNALIAFSERACTDAKAVKDRAEYLAILRRIYLHKARAKEEELFARIPASVVRTPSAATPVARRRASTSSVLPTTTTATTATTATTGTPGSTSGAAMVVTTSAAAPGIPPSNGSSSDGGGDGGGTGTPSTVGATAAAVAAAAGVPEYPATRRA